MEQFIHDENLKLYRQTLADPNISDANRKIVGKLLADEEAKEMSSSLSAGDKQS